MRPGTLHHCRDPVIFHWQPPRALPQRPGAAAAGGTRQTFAHLSTFAPCLRMKRSRAPIEPSAQWSPAGPSSPMAAAPESGPRDGGERCDQQEGIFKYKLEIAYDGEAYTGWQIQGERATVQLRVERALCRVTQEDRRTLRITAAGRTDAGVHARGQVACFGCNRLLEDMGKLRHSINGLLPDDVRVLSVARVPPDFNARYCSTRKIYRYSILASPVADPFHRHHAVHIRHDIDMEAVAEAAQVFVGRHDFTQFSSRPTGRERIDPVKTIHRFGVSCSAETGLWCLEVEGSGFLYKMVRHMVGALVAVGSGKLSVEALRAVLDKGSADPPTGKYRGWNIAPAHGLVLQQVFYPPHDDPAKLMMPEFEHDEHGRIVLQEITWVEQQDGSFKPTIPANFGQC